MLFVLTHGCGEFIGDDGREDGVVIIFLGLLISGLLDVVTVEF